MEKYFPSQMEKLSHSCRKEKGLPNALVASFIVCIDGVWSSVSLLLTS